MKESCTVKYHADWTKATQWRNVSVKLSWSQGLPRPVETNNAKELGKPVNGLRSVVLLLEYVIKSVSCFQLTYFLILQCQGECGQVGEKGRDVTCYWKGTTQPAGDACKKRRKPRTVTKCRVTNCSRNNEAKQSTTFAPITGNDFYTKPRICIAFLDGRWLF